MYPHHPMPSKHVSCNTAMLKSVEFASGRVILYPHLVYCYKSFWSCVQHLLLNSEFVSNCQLWREYDNTSTNLSSIYNGNVWKEFFNVEESPLIIHFQQTNVHLGAHSMWTSLSPTPILHSL